MAKHVDLPLSCEVKGRQWRLYTFDFTTPDGIFSSYFYAISDEHAAALLLDMKQTAELKGQMIEAGL